LFEVDMLDWKGLLGVVDVDDGSGGAPGMRTGGSVGGGVECLWGMFHVRVNRK
jgi:hypothetical protein